MIPYDESIRKLATEKQAIKAIQLIKQHLIGEETLDEIEVETYKIIIHEYCKDMFFFCKYVLGFNKIGVSHKRWIDKLTKDLPVIRNAIRLKPRGTFKTTIYGIGLILWLWPYISKQLRFLYASANEGLLDEVSSEILDHLQEGSLYTFIFDIRLNPNKKNTSYVINIIGTVGKGFSLTLKTSGSSTTGLHPHFIICDDPSDDKDRESRAVRERKYRWVNTLIPLLVPLELDNITICHQLFIATRWHMEDVIDFLIKKNERLEKKDKFDIEVEQIENPDGTPAYPEIHTIEDIEYLKRSMSNVEFACQYMNNPIPEGSQIFDINRMHFRQPNEIDISNGINYCFLDPSRGKSESDYPATIFVNCQESRIFIFDAIDSKILLADLLYLIANKIIEYRCHTFFYENNGTNLIDTEMKRILTLKGGNCLIVGEPESKNKDNRIVNSQPTLYSGRVLFRSDYEKAYPELIKQIVYYPAWGNDDFPDIVEKATSKFIVPPREPRIRFI